MFPKCDTAEPQALAVLNHRSHLHATLTDIFCRYYWWCVCMCYACARVQVHTHNSMPMESEDNHPTGTSALLPPCFKAAFLFFLVCLHKYSRQDRPIASGRFSCLHLSTPLTRPCLEIHGCVDGWAYFFFLCFSLWKHSSNSQQQ